MIGLVIAFPKLVTHYKGAGTAIEPNNIQIEMPPLGNGGMELPPFGAPQGTGSPVNGDNGMQLPALGLPPPTFGGSGSGGGTGGVNPPPPAVDLSQPPKVE